jgi:integrase
MRVFKTTYTARDGTKRQAKKWFVEVRDHLRVARRFYGFTDKASSQALGRGIEYLVACKVRGKPPDPERCQWLEHAPVNVQEKLATVGLIERSRAAAPLEQHIEDFQSYLTKTKSRRTGWHRSQESIQRTVSRIRRVVAACGFGLWDDIDCGRIELYLGEQVLHPKTYNGYVVALGQFANWMLARGRAKVSPLAPLYRLPVKINANDRRAFTPEEALRLLTATERAPFRFGMSGHERAVLYLLAMETGLRVRELRSLQVSSFDFEACQVVVRAEFCKNREQATQLLKHARAEQLQQFSADKPVEAAAFHLPSSYRMAAMLRADCHDAEIEVQNERGKIVFHCLRHMLATNLDKTGASLKERMAIMRHSDRASLTLGVYTHVTTYDIRRAIERLPDYPWPGTERTEVTASPQVKKGGARLARLPR